MAPADAALIGVYAFVALYFVRRFIRYQKWPSIGIAMLPMGWVVLALEPLPAPALAALKWVGVGLGLALIVAVTLADRRNP